MEVAKHCSTTKRRGTDVFHKNRPVPLCVEVPGHDIHLLLDGVDYLFIPSSVGAWRIIEGINLSLIQNPNFFNKLVLFIQLLRRISTVSNG